MDNSKDFARSESGDGNDDILDRAFDSPASSDEAQSKWGVRMNDRDRSPVRSPIAGRHNSIPITHGAAVLTSPESGEHAESVGR